LIILGIDPGLGTTGWGVIFSEGNRLTHIANGRIKTDPAHPLSQRLALLGEALNQIIAAHDARHAAMDAQSTLKLAQARGMLLGCLGSRQIAVGEYAPRLVKLAVTGTGAAEKTQVHAMIGRLLPGVKIDGADAADALAVAITHAHHLASAHRPKA
jgi:crossover junction endodeoxyribonuclease RuvC